MLIQSIYDQYHIPPHLQLHMLRVAGVCQMICDHWTGDEIDRHSLVSAALIHDMGNMVKFRYNEQTKKLFEGVNLEDLITLKEAMIEKYGHDDHIANVRIARELGVSEKIIELTDSTYFGNLEKFIFSTDAEKILMIYFDQRVGPFGILSIYDRLREAAIRYNRLDRQERILESTNLVSSHEHIIFQHCSLSPTDITDETIDPLLEDLRSFDILTTGR